MLRPVSSAAQPAAEALALRTGRPSDLPQLVQGRSHAEQAGAALISSREMRTGLSISTLQALLSAKDRMSAPVPTC